jgi:hypothetical protein
MTASNDVRIRAVCRAMGQKGKRRLLISCVYEISLSLLFSPTVPVVFQALFFVST